MVVADCGILSILTWADGSAAERVLKSFCKLNSSMSPLTRMGKFSRALAAPFAVADPADPPSWHR